MPIVTISRGSYSRGKEVAEELARVMGYECISRDIILEASEQFNIPELKLIRAIHDAPSVLDRFTYGKERFVVFFRAALLKHLQRDNVVYHGLAGHFFVQNMPHVLKVRISADIEARIREEIKRKNISASEARHVLVKDDAERRKWGLQLYGMDTWNPLLYDIVIHTRRIDIPDAVFIIQQTLQRPCFQTTPRSRRLLDDLSLAAQVESALVKEYPKVTADAKNGEVIVNIRASLIDEQSITEKVKGMCAKVDGLESINVNIVPFVVDD
ncbi:MAG: cytidylate kinase-like family protein [Desulfobacterales bacterium]|jgi:cytidylate kinase|nr:cytidylate kinase-like family protein [Desulfobacterales bacterium]